MTFLFKLVQALRRITIIAFILKTAFNNLENYIHNSICFS